MLSLPGAHTLWTPLHKEIDIYIIQPVNERVFFFYGSKFVSIEGTKEDAYQISMMKRHVKAGFWEG